MHYYLVIKEKIRIFALLTRMRTKTLMMTKKRRQNRDSDTRNSFLTVFTL